MIPRAQSRAARRGLAIGLALLAVAAGIGLWAGGLRDRILPKRWGVAMAPSVYRSGQVSAGLIEKTLRRHGIRTVVDLTDRHTAGPDREAERLAIQDLGIERIRAPLEGDGRGDPESYVLAVRAMATALRTGRPTLVHCQSGVQRVGGVVAAYRLLVERRSAAEAVAELKAWGWKPKDDLVLLEFLDANLGRIGARLVEEKVVDRVPDPLPRLAPSGPLP